MSIDSPVRPADAHHRLLRYTTSERREAAPLRLRLAVTFGVVAALHIIGFGLAFSDGLTGASGGLVLGMVGTAYVVAMRHAFDADHLIAIDGATRKFIADGRRPVSGGLAFSLGHSSVVVVASILVILGVSGANRAVSGESSVTDVLGLTGSLVAGAFLTLLGVVNAVILWGVVRGRGHHPEDSEAPTLFSRLMSRPLNSISHPRHLFIAGGLMGLGFDTASVIGLLILTASGAAAGVSTLTLLAVPICFAAGMTLGDTLNGMAMMRVYSTADSGAQRRRRFNAAITALSVVAALSIGGTILVTTLRDALDLHDPVSGFIASLDLEYVGFVIAGVCGAVWLVTEVVMRKTNSAPARTSHAN